VLAQGTADGAKKLGAFGKNQLRKPIDLLTRDRNDRSEPTVPDDVSKVLTPKRQAVQMSSQLGESVLLNQELEMTENEGNKSKLLDLSSHSQVYTLSGKISTRPAKNTVLDDRDMLTPLLNDDLEEQKGDL